MGSPEVFVGALCLDDIFLKMAIGSPNAQTKPPLKGLPKTEAPST
jgi:hypothetical protein